MGGKQLNLIKTDDGHYVSLPSQAKSSHPELDSGSGGCTRLRVTRKGSFRGIRPAGINEVLSHASSRLDELISRRCYSTFTWCFFTGGLPLVNTSTSLDNPPIA